MKKNLILVLFLLLQTGCSLQDSEVSAIKGAPDRDTITYARQQAFIAATPVAEGDLEFGKVWACNTRQAWGNETWNQDSFFTYRTVSEPGLIESLLRNDDRWVHDGFFTRTQDGELTQSISHNNGACRMIVSMSIRTSGSGALIVETRERPISDCRYDQSVFRSIVAPQEYLNAYTYCTLID